MDVSDAKDATPVATQDGVAPGGTPVPARRLPPPPSPIRGFARDLFSRELLRYLGPGFIVTIGFIDPGNWATNIAGGSEFGYQLLWVVSLSTLMLIFLQHLSAKLGIVTGRSLAANVRTHLPRARRLRRRRDHRPRLHGHRPRRVSRRRSRLQPALRHPALAGRADHRRSSSSSPSSGSSTTSSSA